MSIQRFSRTFGSHPLQGSGWRHRKQPPRARRLAVATNLLYCHRLPHLHVKQSISKFPESLYGAIKRLDFQFGMHLILNRNLAALAALAVTIHETILSITVPLTMARLTDERRNFMPAVLGA